MRTGRGDDGRRGLAGLHQEHQRQAAIYSPPVFGDTVGAGDSLMAGILTFLAEVGSLTPGKLGQVDQKTLAQTLRFGAVVAGLNCAHKGCNPPRRAEVDAVLARSAERLTDPSFANDRRLW